MRSTRAIDLGVVVALGALVAWAGGSAVGDDDGGRNDGPVIAVTGWDSYPTAQITGQLRLVRGCLLIGESVAFWAAGTSWDAARQEVELEDAAAVRVGDDFAGGGGHYSEAGLDGLGGVDAGAVSACLRRTGADDAVVATPP